MKHIQIYLLSAREPCRVSLCPCNSNVLGTVFVPGLAGEFIRDLGGEDTKERGITSSKILEKRLERPDITLALKVGNIEGGIFFAVLIKVFIQAHRPR